jgi:hypothetical protein
VGIFEELRTADCDLVIRHSIVDHYITGNPELFENLELLVDRRLPQFDNAISFPVNVGKRYSAEIGDGRVEVYILGFCRKNGEVHVLGVGHNNDPSFYKMDKIGADWPRY